MQSPGISCSFIRREFVGAELGDARLSDRLLAVADSLAGAPDRSLPQAIRSRGQLEAAYRLFGHDRVTLGRILEPHFGQTCARIAQHRIALAVHDTSALEYSGERSGLGPLGGAKHRGFLLHATLAVTADGLRQPLGVLAARTWARPETKRPKRNGRAMSGPEYARITEKESQRWAEQIEETEARVGEAAQLIHLADREGDAYLLLQALHDKHRRYVIRAARDRRIEEHDEDATRLAEACARAEHVIEFEVPIAPRKAPKAPRAAKTHQARESRLARLAVSAIVVDLVQPPYLGRGKSLRVNVVYVRELDAPADAPSLQWVLYTSEPIDTLQDRLAVIEYYRARWLIEEFFKALKTGCQIEKLQLESYESLTNALGVYLPIAWACLALRTVSRTRPTEPATAVLSPTQLQVLRRFGSHKLPAEPTVRDALIAVAVFGGYIPHRKPPGWLTLARGMQDLLRYELVWDAAKAEADVRDP
jgi:hypothetical protein